jgi:hypothetical protein
VISKVRSGPSSIATMTSGSTNADAFMRFHEPHSHQKSRCCSGPHQIT